MFGYVDVDVTNEINSTYVIDCVDTNILESPECIKFQAI